LGPCTTSLPGICSTGTLTCVNGQPVCIQNQQPHPETCNGLDDNCNGIVDDGAPCPQCQSCQNGACAPDAVLEGSPCNRVCPAGSIGECSGGVCVCVPLV
jgi:hypothetical protein